MPTAVVLLSALVVLAPPADKPGPKPERVTLEGLVASDPVPAGYEVTSKEITDGKTVRGHNLFVTKEGKVTKAYIGIEDRAITTRAAKVAAAKGYINGVAQGLAKSGATLVKKTIPDLEKADWAKRFVADLVFEMPDQKTLNVQVQVFFGKAGYHIVILGDNQDDFDLLVKWARSVEPG